MMDAFDRVRPATPRTPRERRLRRRTPLVSGIVAVILAAGLGILIASRSNGTPFSLDVEWMGEMVENRAPVGEILAQLMNYLGGGVFGVVVVPLLILGWLLIITRRWGAGYFLVAALASAGVVQLLKTLFGRDRPDQILVVADFGSFPSGHTANAATIAIVLGVLFPRVWVWLLGAAYVVVMALSRTYLGAHWVTDTLGGILIGAGVALVLWAPFAVILERERTRRRDEVESRNRRRADAAIGVGPRQSNPTSEPPDGSRGRQYPSG